MRRNDRSAGPGLPRLALLAAVLSSAAACSVITGFGRVVLDDGDGGGDLDGDVDGDGDADGCEPDCGDRECGPDGCGGECGYCDTGLFCDPWGYCGGECYPSCDDRECGPDGCGGECGRCGPDLFCDESGRCVWDCAPSCEGRQCGPDGCGGDCGVCPVGAYCEEDSGTCVGACGCEERECGWDGCGEFCGDCPDGRVCDEAAGRCVPNGCLPGTRMGVACGPGGYCEPPLECLAPPFLEGPGICSHRCRVEEDDCIGSPGATALCLDIAEDGGGWCLFDCADATRCPCEVPCRLVSPGLGVCFP